MGTREQDPAIVGVSDRIPRLGEDVDYWDLHINLAREALEDAGLQTSDVDGVVFSRSGYPEAKPVFPTSFCEYLNLRPAWMETAPHGGAQTLSQVWRAATGIKNNFADVVLMIAADNRGTRFSRSGVVNRIAAQNVDPEFEFPYGPIFISNFALMAQRHMHEFGTTPEQLAMAAVVQRTWASMHPDALMRDPLTVEDVLASRMITSPLHLLDICPVTDGGGAAVMVVNDRANDGPHAPVYVRGYGECGDSQTITHLTDLIRPSMIRRASSRAFEMARLDPSDVDVAYPYAPTSFNYIWMLEQLGLCKPGEAAEFVASGETHPGGSLPCNTHGGLMSYAHPGMPGAFLNNNEAVRQLRGEAGERQVPDANVAVTSGKGGLITAGIVVLGTEPTQR
jgi:acetyl-CoA acetyltransferase